MFTKYLESSLKEEDACYVEDVAAGKGWLHLIKKGQISTHRKYKNLNTK